MSICHVMLSCRYVIRKTKPNVKIRSEIYANGGPWAKRKRFCNTLIVRRIGGNTIRLCL